MTSSLPSREDSARPSLSTVVSGVLVLVLAACGGSPQTGPPEPPPPPPPPPPAPQPAARIEIAPGAVLLTGIGASQRLTARVFDAGGQPTTATVVWRSSSPTITVTPDGTATAVAGLGTALITAEASGVTSPPIIALVAQPAAGAVLVSDDHVVGTPVALDPPEVFGPGWRYQVTLRGIPAPAPGALLLPAGGAVVVGRVAAVASAGADHLVTLELVPLTDLFAALKFTLQMPMRVDDVAPAGLGAATPWRPAPLGAVDEIEVPLGPFKCKLAGLSLPTLTNVTHSLTGSLSGNLDFDLAVGLTAVVEGQILARATARPVIPDAVTGKGKCELDIKSFSLPVGHPVLALFFGLQVPVGVGFDLDAALEVGQVGFELSAEVGATVQLGFTCTVEDPSCTFLRSFDAQGDARAELVAPSLDSVRIKLTGRPYGYAKLKLAPGPALTFLPDEIKQKMTFKLLEASAGPTFSLDLAGAHKQVMDFGYASGFDGAYKVEIKLDLEATLGVQQLGQRVGFLWQGFQFSFCCDPIPLFESPKGTLTIEPTSVRPGNESELGDLVTFRVALDPVTILGSYAVDRVEIQWLQSTGGVTTLANGRPPCTTLTPTANGQQQFTCEVDFLDEHVGTQTFVAFVYPRLFGIPLPVPLEVAADSRATVEVEPDWSYTNDFSGAAGPEWSRQQIATSPGGGRFLGIFDNGSVSLQLGSLPQHAEIVVEMDLYILGTMDGNSAKHGPDIIRFELDGTTLKTTTFSNDGPGSDLTPQAFPGDYPSGNFPPGTGATGVNTLGYPPDSEEDQFEDTTYRLTFTVPHSATTFQFVVRGMGQEPYPNEGWGIDNIRVTVK